MGFGKKREVLYALKPDVAVIPECSQDAVKLCADDGYSTCWWGDKKHKGLAVIASKRWTLEVGSPPTRSGSPQSRCEALRTFSYLPFGLAQLVK